MGILLGLADIATQPTLFVRAGGELVAVARGIPGEPISIRFIHSVQKTPVLENLAVEVGGGLRLISTEYQSFGVGLPFLASEGHFYQDGDHYVLEDMDRHFPRLTLRVGVGTQLTLYLKGRTYPLYEKYPPGTSVDIYVTPLLKGMLL